MALKREEEEDVDAYERAMREGIGADEHLNNVWWRTDKFELLQGGMFRFRVPENPEMSFAVPMTWVALRTMSTASATTDEKVEKARNDAKLHAEELVQKHVTEVKSLLKEHHETRLGAAATN